MILARRRNNNAAMPGIFNEPDMTPSAGLAS